MVMRGVEKLQSKTVTSSMLGELRENPKSREEFLKLIRAPWLKLSSDMRHLIACEIKLY